MDQYHDIDIGNLIVTPEAKSSYCRYIASVSILELLMLVSVLGLN